MNATYAPGYSATAPAEVATLFSGRRVSDPTKRPLLFSPGFGWGPERAVSEWALGCVRWASAGLVGICGDFGGTNTFGNDTSQARIDDGWAHVKAQFDCADDKVVLVGQSMGGADVLNWARRNLASVAAIALLVPAVHVDYLYDNDSGGLASDIDAAFGGNWAASEPEYDPINFADEFVGIPGQIWSSSDDPWTTRVSHEAFCAASGFDLIDTGANGHGVGGIDRDEVYDFARGYA